MKSAICGQDTLYGAVRTFTTLPITVTTLSANNITQARGTIRGKIVCGDAPNVIKGFEYQLYTDTIYTFVNTTGNDTLYANLTNLRPNKTYQFRLFVVYGQDTTYGSILSFTTLPITVTTLAVSNITQTQATAMGNIIYGDASGTITGFEYKLSTDAVYTVVNIAGNDTIVFNLTNLRPAKNYQIRAFAIYGIDTIYGSVRTFSALSISVTTLSVSNITQTQATIKAKIIVGDAPNVITGFEYKLSTDAVYTAVNVVGNDTIEFILSNLTPGKFYYVRAFAVYGVDTIYSSSTYGFSTASITITPLTAINITQTQATIRGKIVLGDITTGVRGLEYKLSTDATYTPVNAVGNDTIIYNLTNLRPQKTYYVRAFAIYNNDTLYSSYALGFSTLPVTVTTLSASDIGQDSALLRGTVSFGDAPLSIVGFSVNNTGIYAQPFSSSSFSYSINNLSPNTSYTYRAFAVCNIDTIWGITQTFTTYAFGKDTDDVYIIANINDLLHLANEIENATPMYVSAHYKLANDIILPNTRNNILSIGRYDTSAVDCRPFCGTFDGQNHIIENVYIDQPNSPYQGFFGYTKGAHINNLGLVNITASGRNYTGGMIAYAENTYLYNSYVSGGSLFALSYVGGLVGYQTPGTNSIISGCYNTCEVTGYRYVGGLLGYSNQGTVRNSYVAALVTGQDSTTGAIIGGALDVLSYHCYFNDSITGQTVAIGENRFSNSITGNTKQHKDGDESKTSLDMRTDNFVAILNQGLSEAIWRKDYEPPINNGFPILIWQKNRDTVLSVTESISAKNLKVYPNPAHSELTIENSELTIGDKIEIFNILGQLKQTVIVNQIPVIQVDISQFPIGMYFIKIGSWRGKFVVN
jgi:hypothetical protein